ncbi:MAG: RidA family protein [Cyclobacteriaceae bacterium]
MRSSIWLTVFTVVLSACTPSDSTKVSYNASEEFKKAGLPFSEVVIVGNMMYLSGQVGSSADNPMKLVDGGIKEEAKQALENIKQVLEKNGSSMENIVKCTVMLADISEWGEFNKEYIKYFPGDKPARSAFATNGLALNARVEIECIAVLKK